MELGPQVTLEQMLDAREHTAALQRELLGSFPGHALVSFGLNVPGPFKTGPLLDRAFDEGCSRILGALDACGIPMTHSVTEKPMTGYHAYFLVKPDAAAIKAAMTRVEEADELGRLFDIDVIDERGRKLSRTELGLPARRCFICGEDAFICARSRAHGVDQMLRYIEGVLARWSGEESDVGDRSEDMRGGPAAFSAWLERALRFALVGELDTTPKPGLVDRDDNGSHVDMDYALFLRSVDAVVPSLVRMGIAGRDWAGPVESLFPVIQRIGVEADHAMLRATGGVNTHKGAIFTLGFLSAAVGLYVRTHGGDLSVFDASRALSRGHILELAREIAAPWMEDALAAMGRDLTAAGPGAASRLVTHGEAALRMYGFRGARGEALDGFPAVRCALARYEWCRATWGDEAIWAHPDEAKVDMLLASMASLDDTNLVARGGLQGLALVKDASAAILADGGALAPAGIKRVRELNRLCIDRNLSPGGSADVLAAALFLLWVDGSVRWQRDGAWLTDIHGLRS